MLCDRGTTCVCKQGFAGDSCCTEREKERSWKKKKKKNRPTDMGGETFGYVT